MSLRIYEHQASGTDTCFRKILLIQPSPRQNNHRQDKRHAITSAHENQFLHVVSRTLSSAHFRAAIVAAFKLFDVCAPQTITADPERNKIKLNHYPRTFTSILTQKVMTSTLRWLSVPIRYHNHPGARPCNTAEGMLASSNKSSAPDAPLHPPEC